MKKLLLPLLLLLSQLSFACGKERWSVKTLADDDAKQIDLRVSTLSSIKLLTSFKAPTRKELIRMQDSRYPQEERLYTVKGNVLEFKLEGDGDVHVVLINGRRSMIAELPSPDCVQDVKLKKIFKDVRDNFENHFGRAKAKVTHVERDDLTVTVTGVFFFDFIHGQLGVAKNGAELHPVIDLVVEGAH